MVLEPLGDDITNYGVKSLGGDMVTQLGATLANPDASTVGKEDIIAANPDVIFVVYMPYAVRVLSITAFASSTIACALSCTSKIFPIFKISVNSFSSVLSPSGRVLVL